jgi:penicillin-binding protein 1A
MDQIMILQRWSKTTTIDSRMQLHAEEAVSAHMANRKFSINQRIIKRSFVNISSVETKRFLIKL